MSSNIKIRVNTAIIQESERPFIIAGPCSVESEEQVFSTARALSMMNGIHVFRAGIWKPRTRPNSFEGIGVKGLPWLQKIKMEFNLPVAVEVATAHHVNECLKYDIDILWLGARTTVNPFMVSEISEALRGVNMPVMVKNPINPDLKLWLGALERLNLVGIVDLTAIHRGFSVVNQKNQYRYPPQWQIPIELKRILPDLPILCDPSHICGNTNNLQSVAQKALDLQMSGLMIECHMDPSKALSDANQQITPDQLDSLLKKLVLRSPYSSNTFIEHKLEMLRCNINDIDNELIELLEKRLQVIKTIAHLKLENNLTILQLMRWEEIVNKLMTYSNQLPLRKDFLFELFNLIHQESIHLQDQLMNQNTEVLSTESTYKP